jgi:hypothetical protein
LLLQMAQRWRNLADQTPRAMTRSSNGANRAVNDAAEASTEYPVLRIPHGIEERTVAANSARTPAAICTRVDGPPG